MCAGNADFTDADVRRKPYRPWIDAAFARRNGCPAAKTRSSAKKKRGARR